MSPISEKIELKDNTLSLVQKLMVIFLSCLLFLSMLPVGLFSNPTQQEPEGELIRVFPSAEDYSDDSDISVKKIGNGFDASYTFNLEHLSQTKAQDIHSVHLRLAFLKGSGTINNKVRVSVADTSHLSAQTLAFIYPQTRGADDSLSEVDITEYIKNSLADGIFEVSIRLSADMPICAEIATASYNDPTYRPCLKAVTGDASDTDALTLKKAELADCVYVSAEQPTRTGLDLASGDALLSGGGNETYLRFNINEAAISGSVYDAVLSLDKLGTDDCDIRIYCINNNEWTADTISYNERPRGDESTVFSAGSAPMGSDGRISFDVTQAVCEARQLGISSLTFRITGTDSIAAFSGSNNSRHAPRLYLRASDNPDIVSTSEAALAALGGNRASFVTMKLLDSYSDENGTDARIRWSEYSYDGENLGNKHISRNGEITRPKWFEGDAEVLAVAQIRSGRYDTARRYSITIPAESAPNYSNYTFSNYTAFGSTEVEEAQKLEFVNTSGIKRRWIDGRMFTYRVMENDGVMALNFPCLPDGINYITLKLWEGDSFDFGGFSATLCDEPSASLQLAPPTKAESSDSGFMYATYALPEEFTRGKTHISLRLSYANRNAEFEPIGLYAAYLTQSPFFDPKQFSKQGEKSISEPLFGESAIYKFIDALRNLSTPLNFRNNISDTANVSPTNQAVSIDEETNSIVFAGEDANIAFTLSDTATIYQRLEYYDRYCFGCPVINNGELTAVDYGDYKLIWNKSKTETADIPYEKIAFSGAYYEALSGKYYTFSEDWQLTDDSSIPETAEILNGKTLTISPDSAVLLIHIAEPIWDSDWRVSKINGKNVSDMTFSDDEKINSVTVKCVGNIPYDTESITVLFGIYKDEKLISASRKDVPVTLSTDTYTADFSEFNLSVKKGLTIRVFIFDNTDFLSGVSPKLELP